MPKCKYSTGDMFEYVGYNDLTLGRIVQLDKIQKYTSTNTLYFKGFNYTDSFTMNETEWDKIIRYNFKVITSDLRHDEKR